MIDMPDALSAWVLPPPAARAVGHVEPIRAFDSLADVVRFLSGGQPIAGEAAQKIRGR